MILSLIAGILNKTMSTFDHLEITEARKNYNNKKKTVLQFELLPQAAQALKMKKKK